VNGKTIRVTIRDVEAIEKFLLPFPASYKVSRFRVSFRFQPLSSKCFRFHKNLTASTVSASSFGFHIAATSFVKNASPSGSSKSQMLPSLLPLPSSFFKVLPLPQKFNASTASTSSVCFRFHIPSYKNAKIILWWTISKLSTMQQNEE